jgi:hypothetical protein
VKLFQIEEPDGSPADASLPGAAIGVDVSGAVAEAAFSVGGNAVTLVERAEFARIVPVPGLTAAAAAWRSLFEGVRLRGERALARPVTHAVVAIGAAQPGIAEVLRAAAAEAGIEILRIANAAELAGGDTPALAAALLAEDLLPRSGTESTGTAYFTRCPR